MKKIQILVIALIAGIVSVKANPVDANTAQTVAANFYAANYASAARALNWLIRIGMPMAVPSTMCLM